jgi:hypothetical protein
VRDSIEEFDSWLRSEFVGINTRLEEAYFAERVDVIVGRPDLDELKHDLLRQGGPLMARLADLPALPQDPRDQYRLLGLVGHYLAACQRHEAPLSDAEGGRQAAWDVSLRIGASLHVAPRLVFAHQSLFNDAIGGRFHTFTALPDEEIFIRYNALGVLGYYRAAHALGGIAGIGVTSAVAAYLFDEAETALRNVLKFNQDLGRQLDVDRFFFNIRPYFKTYRVGAVDYRGANAGDFSAINEIDVTLGLCSMDDPFYRAIVKEKLPYVPPDDQRALRGLDGQRSLVEEFSRELDAAGPSAEWKANAARFLAVCKAHAAAYAYHHNRFIKAYIEAPAKANATAHSAGVTSSGPPLADVVGMLHRLLDLRSARPGVSAASALIARIQQHVGA